MDFLDPVKFVELCWPEITLYDKQKEILYSVRDNDETVVPAGNALGKDFIAGLCALWFFVSRRPSRVVTTSVKNDQLEDVLWGEIRRFVDSAEISLPIQFNHLHIRQVRADGTFVPLTQLRGQVAKQGEALLGRHLGRQTDDIPRTLLIIDEASGFENDLYEKADTWTHRKLIIGNCYPCNNFFYTGVKSGSLMSPSKDRYYRKVIRIRAEDSPNVKLARKQILEGKEPTNEILIPGVLSWADYCKRRELWDKVRQTIGLDAEFYEGAQFLMYPPEWLNNAEDIARTVHTEHPLSGRKAKAMGVDPAEGGDKSVWVVIDEYGVIEIVSLDTPDTTQVVGRTLALMKQYGIKDTSVAFDAGGGGKEHSDRLRSMGYLVRCIAFGESVRKIARTRKAKRLEKLDEHEEGQVYRNRRAQMYDTLRNLLNPDLHYKFGIDQKFVELRRQMSPIPRIFDHEGVLTLPPKHKKDPKSKQQTIVELLGCSPDELDALVLAVHAMTNKEVPRRAGALR
jgi:hypothetical protein